MLLEALIDVTEESHQFKVAQELVGLGLAQLLGRGCGGWFVNGCTR